MTHQSPHIAMGLPQRVFNSLGLCGFRVEDRETGPREALAKPTSQLKQCGLKTALQQLPGCPNAPDQTACGELNGHE